jgi:hypothetical protein
MLLFCWNLVSSTKNEEKNGAMQADPNGLLEIEEVEPAAINKNLRSIH